MARGSERAPQQARQQGRTRSPKPRGRALKAAQWADKPAATSRGRNKQQQHTRGDASPSPEPRGRRRARVQSDVVGTASLQLQTRVQSRSPTGRSPGSGTHLAHLATPPAFKGVIEDAKPFSVWIESGLWLVALYFLLLLPVVRSHIIKL